ncbi:hypothetical protein ACR2XN_29280, partial [Klebsiella pneumoniae]
SDKCREFFKAIKGVGKNFTWTPTCEEAFEKLKEHLGSPPLLSKPLDGDVLILYDHIEYDFEELPQIYLQQVEINSNEKCIFFKRFKSLSRPEKSSTTNPLSTLDLIFKKNLNIQNF